jgi:hypothetical protein
LCAASRSRSTPSSDDDGRTPAGGDDGDERPR